MEICIRNFKIRISNSELNYDFKLLVLQFAFWICILGRLKYEFSILHFRKLKIYLWNFKVRTLDFDFCGREFRIMNFLKSKFEFSKFDFRFKMFRNGKVLSRNGTVSIRNGKTLPLTEPSSLKSSAPNETPNSEPQTLNPEFSISKRSATERFRLGRDGFDPQRDCFLKK